MLKSKGEYPDKMCHSVNLFENISTATETMTQKLSIYLLGMSTHVFNFIFKTSQHPCMKVLINERFFFPNELICFSSIAGFL